MIAAAALALSLAGPISAADAAAPEASADATVKAPEAQKPAPFPLHASVGQTTSMGSATYVLSPANPTVQSQLSLGGSAKLTDEWNASANLRVGFEWTNSDSDTYNHQLELADPRFGISYAPAYLNFKDLGVAVSFSGNYGLPISMASRAIGSTGPLGLGARASWAAEKVLPGFGAYVGLNGGYTPQIGALSARYFNAQAGKSFTATNGETIPTLNCVAGSRSGDPENFGCAGIARARWALGLGASYQLNEQVSFAGDLSYGQSFGQYFAPSTGTTTGSDGFVYDNADLKGEHAVDGFAPSESTTASLAVSWQPTPWFALSGGTSSGQPLWSLDHKSLRFPLWDFVSPANNFSSLFVDTTFTF